MIVLLGWFLVVGLIFTLNLELEVSLKKLGLSIENRLVCCLEKLLFSITKMLVAVFSVFHTSQTVLCIQFLNIA